MSKPHLSVVSSRESTQPKTTKQRPRDVAVNHLESALASGVRGELRDAIQVALDIAKGSGNPEPTQRDYDRLKPGNKLLDLTRPGFLARRNQRGLRYVYRTKVGGKQVEIDIGYLPLKEARAQWDQLRQQHLAGGSLATDQAGDGELPTVAELCELYLRWYADKVKRSGKVDGRLLNKHILPVYGSMRVDEFTSDTIAGLLAAMDHTPRERDKLRACLSTMFNAATGKTKKLTLAETWLPRTFVNPVTSVVTAAHTPVVHKPTEAEILRYATNLLDCDLRQDYIDVLRLQLLTVSRIREITDLAWAEVDLEHKEWKLPAARSKNGEPHTVYLSSDAMDIVRRRHADRVPSDQYVFPAIKNRRKPLRADLVQSVLAGNREQLGVDPGFVSHNVRHAFSTWAGEKGEPVEVVNRCTAHTITVGINRSYNFARLNEPAKALWQRWADFLRRG